MKRFALHAFLLFNAIQTIFGLNFQSGSGGDVMWARGCDWNNNDIGSAQVKGEDCGGRCLNTEGCTHFTWNATINGDTCFLKSGSVQPDDAFTISDEGVRCGYVTTHNAQTISDNESRPPRAVDSNCLSAFRKAALDRHNTLRSKHSAPALVRQANIDQTALSYAQKLARENKFVHSGQKGVGENLYAFYKSDSKADAAFCSNFGANCVQSWYDEIKLYNFDSPGYSDATGHFTQLIWKSSTGIGLGMGQGISGKWNSFYCVAQYTPPGNVVTSDNSLFKKNVLKS
jgi:hypothetical protein